MICLRHSGVVTMTPHNSDCKITLLLDAMKSSQQREPLASRSRSRGGSGNSTRRPRSNSGTRKEGASGGAYMASFVVGRVVSGERMLSDPLSLITAAGNAIEDGGRYDEMSSAFANCRLVQCRSSLSISADRFRGSTVPITQSPASDKMKLGV